jgi:putative addiction module component (TIGR02574 family)
MNALQYIQDNTGNTTAVIVPIDDWNKITERYSDVEELPQWQKNMINQRLESYKKNPEKAMPIEQFFEQMDNDDDI